MRIFLLIISSFFWIDSFSQAKITEIIEHSPDTLRTKYIFPSVTIPDNEQASNKINHELQTDFLNLERHPIKSIFENVWGDSNNLMPTLFDISYEISFNDNRLLSMSLSGEGCGAYCETFTKNYSFDLKTGTRIKIPDLFSEEGQKLLLEYIGLKKTYFLSQKLYVIDTTLRFNTQLDIEERERYLEKKVLYIDCLEFISLESIEYIDFYLTNSDLHIFLGRCSAHVNRAIDDLGDFHIKLPLSIWAPLVTSYTKYLIGKEQ